MKNKIVALVLGIGFLAFLALQILPSKRFSNQNTANTRVADEIYEPKFKYEGNLWFVSEAGDTVQELQIEFADTRAKIQYGMMYRKTMLENTGMLFLMPDGMQMRSFWMKNTFVSLDIIYVDSDQRVVSIQKNAVPKSTASLPSEGPAEYILEVIGGYCDTYGIDKGTQLYWESRSDRPST